LCFRENDPTSAEWIAKAFGQVEIKEAQQGLSYGANDMRDGISLTQVTKLRSNIIPIEVSQLNDLEGYIRLPGRWPFASVKLDWHTPIERAPAYIPATTPRVWSPRPSAATATPPAPSLPAPTVSGDLFSAGERPAEPRPQHAAARTA
jgi:type IV secretory pathway TraG/TraD family ATPase VirD4